MIRATKRKKIKLPTGKTVVIRDCREGYVPILIPTGEGIPDVACLKENDPIVKKARRLARKYLKRIGMDVKESRRRRRIRESYVNPSLMDNFLKWRFFIDGFKIKTSDEMNRGKSPDGMIYFKSYPDEIEIKDPKRLLADEDYLTSLFANIMFLSDKEIDADPNGKTMIITFSD